ncbi:CDP-glycerol glycerophosphotransferase family protein [Salinicoccus sesuvii]|uniref:CDP-glycerol glycerophosphotransferase family protein n=1 Tax=Salinicoccus sesuvii TaxID=868281 RepID=A0ABV7N973_9STAP
MNAFRKKLATRLRNRVPRRVRERLIKKVTLRDVDAQETYFNINLTVQNFFNYKVERKLNIHFISGRTRRILNYTINQDRLQIKVPYAILDEMDRRATIELKFNGKRMIIRMNGDEEYQSLSFFSNSRYFNISAQGSIVLSHLLPEYQFEMEQPAKIERLGGTYCILELTLKEKVETECHLAWLYQNKLRILENVSEDPETLKIEDFATLTQGHPKLYLLKGNTLFPVSYSGTPLSMETVRYEIAFIPDRGYLSAEVVTHEIEMTAFETTIEGESINMRFAFNLPVSPETLLIVDTSTDVVTPVPFPTSEKDAEIRLDVPLGALVDTVSRKKLILKTRGTHPLQLQLNASHLKRIGFGGAIQAEYAHEMLKISFYQRRDGLLGFNVAERPLRRQVTEIDDFTMQGYLKGLDAFIDATPYLSFVDRYSLESVRVEIDRLFRVDLKSLDFTQIKSKEKTVIDLFVEIIHSDGTVLRKEKIKFKHSVYKKDTHYGRHEVTDSDGNVHYHLITTTPFNNLKIESFMIPKSVEITDDTEHKDYAIWLLGERYDTAQDNGYAMFNWLKENTDIEAYYVIEDTAEDYKKIETEKNVLAFGSKAHFDIAFRAGVLLGTHDLENLMPYKTAQGFFHYEDTIKIFLQHGVLGRKPVEYHRQYYELPFDLFIVSSEAEKQEVVMETMGYHENEVAVTGLARFDLLPHDNTPRDILLMPTWRDWINTDEAFLESEYYARYHSLIHNSRLNQLLEDYGVYLNFYPHYRAQSYFNNEHLDLRSHIRFIKLGQQTVQDLLIKHALLITDFSSVSFDFTLMNKPVAYYHFDAGRFFRHGSLRPIPETFIGDIAKNEEALIDAIETYIKNGFQPKAHDLSGILTYQDHNNRKRIYDSVMDKVKQRED